MEKLACILLLLLCLGCTRESKTEKYQKQRSNILNVKERVTEIEIEDVLIGSTSNIYLIDNYLIIIDNQTYDQLNQIFDRNSFKYLASTADREEGPNEIVNIGHVGIDEKNRRFFVSDHGKQKIFSYHLDSVLANPQNYSPALKMAMDASQFPDRYHYINDTLCIGLIIEPIGNNNFHPSVGKWNMLNGTIEKMPYTHPKIEKKRITHAVSMEHNQYVEAYIYHDLLTVCNLEGELLYNIYGSKWEENQSRLLHYGEVKFCKDRIFALYSGEASYSQELNRDNYPTRFLIFDLEGNYLQTLETGYRILHFIYDETHNRLIMNMDDTIQFGYLDLEGIL